MKNFLIFLIFIPVTVKSIPLIIPGTDTILIGRIDGMHQINRQFRLIFMNFLHNFDNIITIFHRIYIQSVGPQEQFHRIRVKTCFFLIIIPVKTAGFLIIERMHFFMGVFHRVRTVGQIVGCRKASSRLCQRAAHTAGSHIDNLIIRKRIQFFISCCIAGQAVSDGQQ